MSRRVRAGCLILIVSAIGGIVQLFVFLFVLGSLVAPPEKPSKQTGQRSGRVGGPSATQDRQRVTVQGMPFPPLDPHLVRVEIAIFERVVRRLRMFGETAALARGCAFLATLHAAVDQHGRAEQLFSEARKILSKRPEAAVDLAWVHNNHGLVQMKRGRYAEGVRSFQAAKELSGPKPVQQWRVVALQNLASAKAILGDPGAAERYYFDALELQESVGGTTSMPHQVVRSNLATFYLQIGDYESARTILDQLSSERLDRATRFCVYNNLGYVLTMQDRFADAEHWFGEAEQIAGAIGLARAAVLVNRTAAYSRAGRLDLAADTGKAALRSIEIAEGTDSSPVGAALTELAMIEMRRGRLGDAERLLIRAVAIFRTRKDLEAAAVAERALALVAQRLGQHDRAANLSRNALDFSKRHLDNILEFASEAQRLEYLRYAAPYDQLATFGEPNLLAEAVLSMKGAVLESLLAERKLARAGLPDAETRLDRINELKLQIMQRIAEGNRDIESLKRDLKNEETALARQASLLPHEPKRREVSVPLIQSKLAADQVLVEIIRFRRTDGRIAKEAYGAVVIPSRGSPAWVPLGDAAIIDRAIDRAVSGFGGIGRKRSAANSLSEDVEAALRELERRIWRPLVNAFPPGTQKVVLSPDGGTCFLPWAAMLDDQDRFLAERWQLTQIGAGRDLLRPAHTGISKTLLALGDGAGNLQYSEDEVEWIGETARDHGWSPTILLRARDRECIRSTSSARHPARCDAWRAAAGRNRAGSADASQQKSNV